MKPTLKSSMEQDLEMAAKLQALHNLVSFPQNEFWDAVRLLTLATLNEKEDKELARELRGHAAAALRGRPKQVKEYASKLARHMTAQARRMSGDLFGEIFTF